MYLPCGSRVELLEAGASLQRDTYYKVKVPWEEAKN